MKKNTIKGLAPNIKSSVYPDGSKSHKDWTDKPKSTFNEVFENVYFQTKNAK